MNHLEHHLKLVDLGNPGAAGHHDWDGEQLHLKGAGQNVWGTHDDCAFLAQTWGGDFRIDYRLDWVGKGTHAHRKAGVMVRRDLSPESPMACAVLHGDGLTSLQVRARAGDKTVTLNAPCGPLPVVIFSRTGNHFRMSAATADNPAVAVAEVELDLGETVHVGPFVCSHETGILEEAVFSNLRFSRPATPGGKVHARMEILDTQTANRRVLLETDGHDEAPNWSADGKALFVNRTGLLYRVPLTDPKLEPVPTGIANSVNNDHGLTPDNGHFILSHRSDGEGGFGSRIWVLKKGSVEPRLVTPVAPSYWHGVSPDGKWLAYVAKRGSDPYYQVYRIPFEGGPEERLTCVMAHHDGPDYSADGHWIYFNSNRTGTMQIWKIPSAGGEAIQVTFDPWQNWFPHESPDGRRLVMLSYPAHVPSGAHPANEPVMIRMMDAAGGPVKVLAHLYGGQGTLNVPSWSPDSRHLAFVSYTA